MFGFWALYGKKGPQLYFCPQTALEPVEISKYFLFIMFYVKSNFSHQNIARDKTEHQKLSKWYFMGSLNALVVISRKIWPGGKFLQISTLWSGESCFSTDKPFAFFATWQMIERLIDVLNQTKNEDFLWKNKKKKRRFFFG